MILIEKSIPLIVARIIPLPVVVLLLISSCSNPNRSDKSAGPAAAKIVPYTVIFDGGAYKIQPPSGHQETFGEQRSYTISGLRGISFETLKKTDFITLMVSHGIRIQIEYDRATSSQPDETRITSVSPTTVATGDTLILKIVNGAHAN